MTTPTHHAGRRLHSSDTGVGRSGIRPVGRPRRTSPSSDRGVFMTDFPPSATTTDAVLHSVHITWKPGVDDAHATRVASALTTYAATVPGLLSFRAGSDLALRENSADSGIVACSTTARVIGPMPSPTRTSPSSLTSSRLRRKRGPLPRQRSPPSAPTTTPRTVWGRPRHPGTVPYRGSALSPAHCPSGQTQKRSRGRLARSSGQS